MESPDERHLRQLRQIHAKNVEAAADEDAVDQMIRRNIEEEGP